MKSHSKEELERASDYLEFILHMVKYDFENLGDMPGKSFPKNVYIDSILIRLRSLIEFLCAADTRYDTDVIAKHYLPDFSLPDEQCKWLLEQKQKIDTTLAHLTVRPMPKLISEVQFPYPEMYRVVIEGFRQFFESDPPHVLQQAKDQFQEAHALLNHPDEK